MHLTYLFPCARQVCISTLQVPVPDAEDEGVNVGGYWTPVSGMETIFVSVLSLLSDPNPDSPANAEAARLYRDVRSHLLAHHHTSSALRFVIPA